MPKNKEISGILQGLSEQIFIAKADQKEAIVAIGMPLEMALESVGKDSVAFEPLKLALETLQAIYGGNVADAQGTLKAIGEVVAIAEKHFAEDAREPDGNPFEQSVTNLHTVLDGGTDANGQEQVPDTSGEEVCLDDITARLVGLDAGNSKVLKKIRGELAGMCGDGSPYPQVRRDIQAAVDQLDKILDKSTDDADAALEEVGQAVARAAEIIYDIEEADDERQTTEPQRERREQRTTKAEVTATTDDEGQTTADDREQATETETVDDERQETTTVDDKAQVYCLPEDSDDELLKEYMVECLDHISAAEASLLELESNPEDTEQINTIFRAFHTIKGSSGFLGLDRIQKLAHLAESLLDRSREGQIKIIGGYADLSLQSCDTLKTMIESLDGLQGGDPLDIPKHLDSLLEQLSDPEAAGIGEEELAESLRVGDILVAQGKVEREVVEEAAKTQGDKPIGEVLIEKNVVKAGNVANALRTQKSAGGGASSGSTIRVGTGRLDNLINMVGELVIAQSMVAQDPNVCSGSDQGLGRKISHAEKIIRELQDLTMSLRMVPLKGTFQKMARLVRDLGRKNGKSVSYVTEGEETEIDRNMVEALNDPLVHMMRNAVDHGVESADQRIEAGKEPTGTVCLRAYHAAGNVVIQLQDDGKGLDREKILAKAVERGLVEAGKDLSDSEVFNLIFNPGFSTAEKVTDVSGRGVGMDVVRKNIDSLRGRIEIASKAGEGSTFTIRLPMTMAITDSMLIQVGVERYLLPIISIIQSFRPEKGMISTVTGRGEVVMLRGELLPVFRLHEMFNVADAVTDPAEGLLIIIESDGKRCALMVDKLLGQQQVVIKSLGEGVGHIRGISGGAILGDGRVGLILDAGELLQLVDGEADVCEPFVKAA